jgi:hypothetical protein
VEEARWKGERAVETWTAGSMMFILRGARTTTPRKDDAFQATYLVPSRRAVPRDAQVVEPTTATRRREGLLPRADDGPRANRALLIVEHPARPKLIGVVRTPIN